MDDDPKQIRRLPRPERERLARDPATDPTTLRTLADDGDPAVRALVAANPSTQVFPLLHLARDVQPEVRALADTALKEPRRAELVTAVIPMDWETPPATLERLALDPNSRIRSRVAGNPSTPAASFIRLLADPDPGVRYAAQLASVRPARLAELEQSDAVVLKRWSSDEDERFDRELARPENWSSAFTESNLTHPIPPPGTVVETFGYWWGEWHPRRPRWWRSSAGTGDWLERHVYCRSCRRDIGTYRSLAHDERKVYNPVAPHRLVHRAMDNLDIWRVRGSA